jgi:hypothetical protein
MAPQCEKVTQKMASRYRPLSVLTVAQRAGVDQRHGLVPAANASHFPSGENASALTYVTLT